MKTRSIIFGVALAITVVLLLWFRWQRDAPRRISFQALEAFGDALNSGNAQALLQTTVIPAAIQSRTAAEQTEFLTKALRDEISPEGLEVLRRDGTFGALTNLFPAEGEQWAKQAGVNPEDCVAFKMEGNGLRAEVVLTRQSAIGNRQSEIEYRVLRCNNVKQLAATKL